MTVAWIFAFAALAASVAAARSQPATSTGDAAVRVVLVGDSTMSEYAASRPDRGWGQFVAERFRPGTVDVSNLASPGRSTKTFVAEGRWAKAIELKPDFVIIQFGHNDSHDPKNPESTDATTDYTANLARYVDDARAIGATPILVTPMVRRTFDEAGQLIDAAPPNRPLADYAAATRAVAQSKRVALIDLHASSKAFVEQLGPAESATLANKTGDVTHFNERGARAMADLVFKELPAAAPRLAAVLK